MEYYFNELDPTKFQRLINAILVKRFGEDIRLTPLRGRDGGKDGETAPGNPFFEFKVDNVQDHSKHSLFQPPRNARYLFQIKHHRTTDKKLSDVRQTVLTDFKSEMLKNVLTRKGDDEINYFILITNVSSSREIIHKLDMERQLLLRHSQNLHADIWWQESVTAYLDQMPSIWSGFPEMFAGRIVPFIAKIVDKDTEGLPLAMRLAINCQYRQDSKVKFRQIELEQNLSKLFVDLDIDNSDLSENVRRSILLSEPPTQDPLIEQDDPSVTGQRRNIVWHNSVRQSQHLSALAILLNDDKDTSIRRLILEGGPGQGKSTLTQMAVQVYRERLLGNLPIDPESRWRPPRIMRLPFRIELRKLAEWLSNSPEKSIEEYLAFTIRQESGGDEVSVRDLHRVIETSPLVIVFDGLDEIGSDKLRDEVLKKMVECIQRIDGDLHADLRVIVTTRPPALTGHQERLIGFERLSLAPMEEDRIEEYVKRWLSVQIREDGEQKRIEHSFERRKDEPHVKALSRNPMQLSVLLQFIELKGEAFPDRRAELYRDYFQIVIDRDVEKSPELRENRDVIEALHAFLGYKIHALTEVNQADRTIERERLLLMVSEWLKLRGHDPAMAQQFFKLGEERFGLVVASKGEGEQTRYGYEIQPIQEYFAAAFISDQLVPNRAHEYFEEMIHRTYWKEVALFLAGLRRPNEKADLVLRAKNIDKNRDIGWYQDGRSIVLQLLQEGVLSEPRSVFSDALDFVLDLLDTKRLKLQHEPSNLLNTLEALAVRNPTEHHQDRIFQLTKDYATCTDRYTINRIHRVACGILKPSDYEKAILAYAGDDQRLLAHVRLGLPYRYRNDIKVFSRKPTFWQGASHSIWAEAWWHEATRRKVALDLSAPPGIHQSLLVQFATCPINGSMYIYRELSFMQTRSNLRFGD